MNDKGNVKLIGGLIMVFVAVIVSIALLTGGIASNVAVVTSTQTASNVSLGSPAADSTQNLIGIAASSVIVTNATGGEVVPSTNYTVTNYQIDSTGLLTAQYTQLNGSYAGTALNASYVYEPEGYDTNSGGRAIALLIVTLCGLAIAAFALSIALDKGLLDMIR